MGRSTRWASAFALTAFLIAPIEGPLAQTVYPETFSPKALANLPKLCARDREDTLTILETRLAALDAVIPQSSLDDGERLKEQWKKYVARADTKHVLEVEHNPNYEAAELHSYIKAALATVKNMRKFDARTPLRVRIQTADGLYEESITITDIWDALSQSAFVQRMDPDVRRQMGYRPIEIQGAVNEYIFCWAQTLK